MSKQFSVKWVQWVHSCQFSSDYSHYSVNSCVNKVQSTVSTVLSIRYRIFVFKIVIFQFSSLFKHDIVHKTLIQDNFVHKQYNNDEESMQKNSSHIFPRFVQNSAGSVRCSYVARARFVVLSCDLVYLKGTAYIINHFLLYWVISLWQSIWYCT